MRLKFIFCWAPTNARKVDTKLSDDPRCPLCHHPSKTTSHVLECHSEGACRHQTEALAKLEDTLVAIKTHPYLITMIFEAMQTEANIDFLGATRHVHQVVSEQSGIGWGIVRYGFVLLAWRDCQQHYGQSTDPHYTSR